jgi:hypothetical protein
MKLIINDIVIDNIATPVYTDQVELVVQSGNFHDNIREVHTQELPDQEGVKFTIYFNDGAFVNGLVQISGVGLPYVPIIPEGPVDEVVPEAVTPPVKDFVPDNVPTHTENI